MYDVSVIARENGRLGNVGFNSAKLSELPMPFMFIHGVNVRDKQATLNDAWELAEGLKRFVIAPLAAENLGRLSAIGLVPKSRFVVYWGDVGVRFRWNLKSLPKVRLIDALGAEEADIIATGQPLPGQGEALAALLEDAGIKPDVNDPLLSAARSDLGRFVDVVFAPIIFEGQPLLKDEQTVGAPNPSGDLLLAEVLHEISKDSAALEAVKTSTDDIELLKRLQKRVFELLEAKADEQERANSIATNGGQALGAENSSWSDTLSNVKDRVGEFFGRVRNAPARAATATTLKFTREALNAQLTRFTGDVFEYLNNRDVNGKPGPIVQRVLDAIDAAAKAGLNDPWFIVTHSMGGNILYDVLTHYRPDLDVAVWLSVGGQVGLFEEMKLFHASNVNIPPPASVPAGFAKVDCWLNIYDPVDPFSYLAEPVFGNAVKDIEFSTGASGTSAHTAYFKQRSFFDTVHDGLKSSYKSPKPKERPSS